MTSRPTIESIQEAHRRIEPYIHRTPILTCRSLNEITQSELFFKCENFQEAGVFKIRGATNAVSKLTHDVSLKGVATHSSGNHGAALALAARRRGMRAYVVMPENAPRVKISAVRDYGAEIVFCKPTLESRETTLAEVVSRTGAVFVHPYDNNDVIEGQATAALELCEEIKDLDIVMTPVGGGGLLSGTAIAVSALCPGVRVIAAEPKGADDAYRSFYSGRLIPVESPVTIADGLRTSLGVLTFPIIRDLVHDVVTVSEEAILAAMRYIWERMKIIVEPSAAVTLGGIMTNGSIFRGKRVGIILSGGNIDLDSLPWVR